MANIIQRRRGTTADHVAFTGSEGEITIDLDKETVVVHDAILAGGYPLAREDMSNVLNRIGVAQLSLSEGTDGQVLQTNGSGVISFTNEPNIGSAAVGGDISGTVGNAQIVADSIGINELNLQEGTPGQVLQTNGYGVISFESSVDISSSGVGGDLSGTVGNAQIIADVVGITELDVTDGQSGEILSTDGAGSLSFIPVDLTVGGDLSGTLSTAQINANTVGVSELNLVDGMEGQVINTDGSGTISFQNVFTETTVTPTVGQTVFPIVYMVGRMAVYLNGIKLLNVTDFTATNGTDVTLIGGIPLATVDRVEFHVFC